MPSLLRTVFSTSVVSGSVSGTATTRGGKGGIAWTDAIVRAVAHGINSLVADCHLQPRYSLDRRMIHQTWTAQDAWPSTTPLPDERPERVEVERFREAPDGLHAFGDVWGVEMGGDDDDGNPLDRVVGELSAAELFASHDGHHQVEDDERRVVAAGEVERLDAVGGGDDRGALHLQ